MSEEKKFIIPLEDVCLILNKMDVEGELYFRVGNIGKAGWNYSFGNLYGELNNPYGFKESDENVVKTSEREFNKVVALACEDILKNKPDNGFSKWYKSYKINK